MTNRGRIWAQNTFSNKKQHWATHYCHVNETKSGKISYSPWPFEKMVQYLTEPTDKKNVDSEPIIVLKDDSEPGFKKTTIEEILEAYAKNQNRFELVKSMKANHQSKDTVLQNIYDDVNGDPHQTNMFLKYYDMIDINRDIQLLDPNIKLKPWQQKVISWALEPRSRTEPNGLWMNTRSGGGKTTILQALNDTLGESNIFNMPIRPHGGFDPVSMRSYKGQKIIIIEELTYHIDDDGHPRPKTSLVQLLKSITEHNFMSFEFGGEYTRVLPNAKVIITSNNSRIQIPDQYGSCPITRRYIQLNESDIPIDERIYPSTDVNKTFKDLDIPLHDK